MQRVEHDQWNSADVARLLSLVETERRYYQEIVASVTVAVAVVDDEWGLMAFNREFRRLLGLSQAELAHARLPDLISDPALEEAMEQVRSSGVPEPACVVHIGGEDQARRLSISIQKSPGWLGDQEGEWLLTLHELAEAPPPDPLAETPRDVIETHKRGAIERLSGRVAHLANNLLMIIGGYGEELASGMEAADPRRADIAEILRAADRLAAMTQNLNSLTRPQPAVAEDFDGVAWTASLAAQLGIASSADATVPLVAHGSPALLEGAMRAAHRYMLPHAANGRMTLAARPAGANVIELALSLDGSALPDDVAECIFEPFSGAKEGTDPPLGLAGMIRPLALLEATVHLEGTSTLQIRCPRGSALPPPKPRGRILLVEDEPGIRSLILKALEREGFAVVQASTATDALAAFRLESERPDLMITDLQMPGLQGRTLAAAIRAEYPGLRVLYISGATGDEQLDRQIGEETLPPGTRFLAKPFVISELTAQAEELIGLEN